MPEVAQMPPYCGTKFCSAMGGGGGAVHGADQAGQRVGSWMQCKWVLPCFRRVGEAWSGACSPRRPPDHGHHIKPQHRASKSNGRQVPGVPRARLMASSHPQASWGLPGPREVT